VEEEERGRREERRVDKKRGKESERERIAISLSHLGSP
jgi:hypothetical protein